jgi:hypothetical protein
MQVQVVVVQLLFGTRRQVNCLWLLLGEVEVLMVQVPVPMEGLVELI